MDIIKQKRTILRTQTTKLLKRIELKLQNKEVGEEEIEDFLAELQLRENELRKINLEIEPHLKIEEVEQEVLKCDDYNTEIVLWRTRLNREKTKISNKIASEISSTNINSISETVLPKFERTYSNLPKLIIEKFNGDPSDFYRFWDQFDAAINRNNELDEISKFNYLKSYVSGAAAESIKAYTLTKENYASALDTLKNRFGKPTILINTHLNKLLNLKAVRKSTDISSLRQLGDTVKIEIQNLKTLGLKTENYSAMLCPIIMKLLPSDIVLEITRKLKNDQEFQIEEVINIFEEEISNRESALAFSGQGESPMSLTQRRNDSSETKFRPIKSSSASASSLVNETKEKTKCFLCERGHNLMDCKDFDAKTLKEKREFLKKAGRCFICFFKNHLANSCKSSVRCSKCNRRHHEIMCPDKYKINKGVEMESTILSNNISNRNEVMMQTLTINLINKKRKLEIRALFDSGSQKSYLTKNIIEKIGYEPIGELKMTHSLFGGAQETHMHKKYRVFLSDLESKYFCNFEVYDQDRICTGVPKVRDGPWIAEAKKLEINIPDFEKNASCAMRSEIDLLIGADVYGKLLTGNLRTLRSGIVAVETRLGWTLMGKLDSNVHNDSTNTVLSLHVADAHISDLWRLDTLGILDPGEKESREELEKAAENHFQRTIQVTKEGRYEVSLPWINGHPPLSNIKKVAERRLENTVKSLKKTGKLEQYEAVFEEWEQENIITEIPPSEAAEREHFLPHRAVIKENSSTAVRPVFDGSAREKGSPSLNECLEKGPNLVELIPSILNRFRLRKIGVISDIRKAFLQIQLSPDDRRFLKFLWWKHGNSHQVKIYQHNRVVFGLSCSPYLLGATLKYHLNRAPEQLKATATKLAESFYVDNCVTSVENEQQLEKFIYESKHLLSTGKFDLRGWEHNEFQSLNDDSLPTERKCVPVLGLVWNLGSDTLSIDLKESESNENVLTKRKILSDVHRIFDPIGYTCPITLSPKIMLQECWRSKITWDSELPNPIKKKFIKWKEQLIQLKELSIPRCVVDNPEIPNEFSLHVFSDASKVAYATCIFLRCANEKYTTCQLIQARSRVAPLKPLTIPRLELLACTIGARLARTVINDLKFTNMSTYFWTDSSNALYWIKRNENWAPFVYNRVREILSNSSSGDWHYVPGSCNPADLPSRGCTVEQLAKSRWWEGPQWLKNPPEFWPKINIEPDLDVVYAERKKTVIIATNVSPPTLEFFETFTSYKKIIRVTAWIYRFFHNVKTPQNRNLNKHLTVKEIQDAELTVVKYAQNMLNTEEKKPCYQSLHLIKDERGLLRVRSKIALREDLHDFKYPLILPDKHNITHCLIMSKHLDLSHAGVQIVMSVLREQFWILRCRKTVRRILQRCTKCRRFNSSPIEVLEAPLPESRVRDALIFEVIGVDLCGPLILKDQQKSWVVLFTCAVYRAVHLELVKSLSTESFLMAFRRFISRRGRPAIVYSDNGTNFTRSAAELKSINFEQVLEYSTTNKIQWHFNPPAAPWWGGFFERLIGLVKSMLRRVLGRASLQYEELYTILCDIESAINLRPLTYLSEDPEDLLALTPSMFLNEIKDSCVTDFDLIDATKMRKRYEYRQKIREDLRRRFRVEYLGQLKDFAKKRKEQKINVGDVVLVGDNNIKRLNWPLAKVEETYPGKDGKVRVARVKTQTGSYLRPVKKLYHLEMKDE